MPVSIAPSTLPLFVPAELATRPIGGRFALTVEPGEPYFHDLRERWSAALRAAHMAIPRPPYANSL